MLWHFLLDRLNEHAAGRESIHYLEIGVRDGHSLRTALHLPKTKYAVGVDTWGGTYGGTAKGSPDHVIASLDPSERRRTTFISGDSRIVLPMLSHVFDVIFIDGDHSAETCLADLNNAKRLLAPDGLLLTDDVFHVDYSHLANLVSTWADQNKFSCRLHVGGCGMGELHPLPANP